MFVTAVSSQFASVSPHGAPSGGVGGLDAGPDGGDGGEGPEVRAGHQSVESIVLQISDILRCRCVSSALNSAFRNFDGRSDSEMR